MQIKKLHYFSGLIISLFIGAHLFNHFTSIFGVDTHISVMNFLRKIYRNPILEFILLAALLIQVISGLRLYFAKRKIALFSFDKLQLWSGMYMAVFLLIHVGAVLSGRFFLDLDTNIYFGAAGLNTFPFNLFFIPYYTLAILSFFGHVAAIHNYKMKRTIFGITPYTQSIFILVKGIIVTIIILYGLTDGFIGIDIPADYDVLIGK